MLEGPKLVSENRGFLTYGSYEGIEAMIAAHGIGPSTSAIVFEELIMLGAKIVVRSGATGHDLRASRRLCGGVQWGCLRDHRSLYG